MHLLIVNVIMITSLHWSASTIINLVECIHSSTFCCTHPLVTMQQKELNLDLISLAGWSLWRDGCCPVTWTYQLNIVLTSHWSGDYVVSTGGVQFDCKPDWNSQVGREGTLYRKLADHSTETGTHSTHMILMMLSSAWADHEDIHNQ